ncbi:MAG: GNAT family N-acetyltransferase [Oscillospiraceae bacterium]|nr:GNAT family N-acetyltransferase [Oscillospiraceae bacterium]
MTVRVYREEDVPRMVEIWNQVVEDGEAYPQTEKMDERSGAEFFARQSVSAVAVDEQGRVQGLYILHPNNEGRCGHIANASYAVDRAFRGRHMGEQLVLDSLRQGREQGFRLLQFNAVVACNVHARHLYERVGFHLLGTIPGGFLMKDGRYEDICVYYIEL